MTVPNDIRPVRTAAEAGSRNIPNYLLWRNRPDTRAGFASDRWLATQGDAATLDNLGNLFGLDQWSLFRRRAESIARAGDGPSMSDSPSLLQSISVIPGHRNDRAVYPLGNILCMTISAVIAGADDFVATARFVNTKKDFFAKFLDLSADIPSHDRFNTIFKHLDPEISQNALLNRITSLHKVTAGRIFAIDGRTLRRSYDKTDRRSAIHMVSAGASINHISLGQTVVDAKGNEITAIPELPRLIDVAGALVTIGAIDC